MVMPDDDIKWMKLALDEAQKSYDSGQCPVGAVVVRGRQLIAKAGNMERALHDPTAHAEILAIRAVGKFLGRHKLQDCTVYTTLEPCPMCEAAMLQAEIPRVVSGGRTYQWIKNVRFNSDKLAKVAPIMEPECRELFEQWLQESGRTEILEAECLVGSHCTRLIMQGLALYYKLSASSEYCR